MARLFTQEDIEKLTAMNKDMTGVKVGSVMLPREAEDLGYGSAEDPAPNMDPVTAPVVEAAQNTPAVVTNAAPLAAQDTSSAATLQQLLAPQTTTPTDPYANLSKTQRRMLAFSALEDAGASLSGRRGGSFDAMLGRFNEQADMQRKATAAQQRTQLLGGLGLGGAGGDTEASRQAILKAAAAGLIDGPAAKLMIEELDRKEGKASDLSSKKSTIYLIEALMNDPDLGQVLGLEGSARSLLDAVLPGAQEKYNELKSRVEQLRGGIFTEAFKSLRGGGQITEKEGEKASAALARLDTVQGVDAFKQALREYQFYIRQGIARLEGQAIPPNTFFEGPSASSTDPLSDEDLDDLYPPSTPTN